MMKNDATPRPALQHRRIRVVDVVERLGKGRPYHKPGQDFLAVSTAPLAAHNTLQTEVVTFVMIPSVMRFLQVKEEQRKTPLAGVP